MDRRKPLACVRNEKLIVQTAVTPFTDEAVLALICKMDIIL
jgi:hypothetical protein